MRIICESTTGTFVQKEIVPMSGASMATKLLAWYDANARVLPWRSPPNGPNADPYHVWLSEIMLQQTTVATVGPYFRNFLARWPTVQDLAAAPLDDVLHAWAGLGYYARARNLHKCAGVVAYELGGRFPETEDELLGLPGVGPYTAAAIGAIAFNRQTTVVDGNVERVMVRLYARLEPIADIKPELKRRAGLLTPKDRPGDYAQGVMDLGATVCTPRSPRCDLCPWAGECRALAQGIASSLPKRKEKAARPVRRGYIYWLEFADAKAGGPKVLIRRRPEKGLLGGMMEFPSSDWQPTETWQEVAPPSPPIEGEWVRLEGRAEHTFTHFHLELVVMKVRLNNLPKIDGIWQPVDALSDVALPTLMKKVARHVRMAEPTLFQ